MTRPEPASISPARLKLAARRLGEHRVFDRVVLHTRMPMAISDPALPDCPLVFINPAFTELTGYEPASILGRNCRFLQGAETDPDSVSRIRQAVAEHRPIDEEIYNYRRDGSGFWNALHITPIFDDDGALTCFFASQVDVSGRRETLRRQTQRVESMTALASGVAHEFNNLMTVVLGSIERASADAVDDAQRRRLDRADWGAQRAGRLAGELLSLARRQDHQARTVDLNLFVRNFEKTMAHLAGDTIHVDIQAAAEPALARLDPDQLEMVLLNLVGNAVDAMPTGGTVSVAARTLSAPEAAMALGGRKAVELRITDTGHGMPPEIAERATELFFTTKAASPGIAPSPVDREAGRGGTGLGLFLALEFVDKCGGRLAIETAPDQGTQVALVFPQAS